MQNKYDVVIMGGGLAGLTLAMQIKQQNSDISIAILEMRKTDAPHAAHKVGESTVELGTHYIREVLNLKEYLDEHQLPKHGLRFYFSPQVKEQIEARVEFGARYRLHVPSHQLDRGSFENELVQRVRKMDVDVILGARVKDFILDDSNGHTISYTQEQSTKSIQGEWLVDASGRVNIVKRKLGLEQDIPHDINAVWFRVEGEIDVDGWSDNSEWKNYLDKGLRRLSTIHFMGKGYWVWFIPLSSGNTSIGIVADPRFHDFSSINTLEKAYEWLAANEPLCYKHLVDRKDKVLDFRKLKNYAYNSAKFYSSEKWGTVGEAGAFLDPFYSPGTDFISIANTFMSDLIVRHFKGEDVHGRSIIYDRVYGRFFNNWIPIYQDKYEFFDNAQLMVIKITWDWGIYWGIPTLLFTNLGFTNLNVLKTIFTTQNCLGERFGILNKVMQDFYTDWGRAENEQLSHSYVDPIDVPFMRDLHFGLDVMHESDDALINQLESNLKLLEKMAAEIFRTVSHRIKGTPVDMPVNPYEMSLKLNSEELIKQGESAQAISFDPKIAEELAILWLQQKVSL